MEQCLFIIWEYIGVCLLLPSLKEDAEYLIPYISGILPPLLGSFSTAMWIFQQCSLDFLCSAHIHTDKCIYRICAYRNESTLICNIYIYIHTYWGEHIYIYMYNMTRSATKQSRASLRSVSYRKGVIRIVIQHTLDTCPIPIFNDEHMDNLVVIDHSLGKPSAVRK